MAHRALPAEEYAAAAFPVAERSDGSTDAHATDRSPWLRQTRPAPAIQGFPPGNTSDETAAVGAPMPPPWLEQTARRLPLHHHDVRYRCASPPGIAPRPARCAACGSPRIPSHTR